MSSIELRGVSKRFTSGIVSHRVLNDLHAVFQGGSITWLSGKNGVGKTTLLRVLGGLLRPDRGEVLYDGHKLSHQQTLPRIGIVLESDMLFGDLTVEENLTVFQSLQLRNLIRKLENEIDALGVGPFLARRVSDCSQGVRRKVTLLRALIGTPDYILLDEVFSHLDQTSVEAVTQVLKQEASRGVVVVVSGHEGGIAASLDAKLLELTPAQSSAGGVQ